MRYIQCLTSLVNCLPHDVYLYSLVKERRAQGPCPLPASCSSLSCGCSSFGVTLGWAFICWTRACITASASTAGPSPLAASNMRSASETGHSGSDLSIFPRPGSTTSASPLSSSPRPLVRSLAVVHLVTPSFAPSSVFCCYHSSHSASLTILRLGIVINKREQVSHATLCWSRFFAIIACRDWAEQALGICKSCRRLAAIRPHSSHDTDSRLNVVKPALPSPNSIFSCCCNLGHNPPKRASPLCLPFSQTRTTWFCPSLSTQERSPRIDYNYNNNNNNTSPNTKSSRKGVIRMDPDCAICHAPASHACECEAKGLEVAVRQAEARMMQSIYNDIRSWVRAHAQDYILEYFRLLTERRKATHAQHLERITAHAYHYYHAPPHPNEIAAAQQALKRGIDEDWQASVQRYPEVLEYFYSLVELTLPDDNEPAVKDPPLSALQGSRKAARRNTGPGTAVSGPSLAAPPPHLHEREPLPLPRGRTPPPLEPLRERRTPAPPGGGRRQSYRGPPPGPPPPPASAYFPPQYGPM
ncbi:hypothetical protein QC763_304050 [Podospora pseudopauciseta]|uniref:Serine/threonine protein phosphatase n=1 Tax=Podospora pseudopauciseta TaxID=2093780 RepID=A0ABR0HG90_9PEZI|nr:hypothetical protein QC763_304050 [Podospora pseudopauciseta]